jgi:hypothetical protein
MTRLERSRQSIFYGTIPVFTWRKVEKSSNPKLVQTLVTDLKWEIFQIQNKSAKITPPSHSTMCCLNISYSLKRKQMASLPAIQINTDTCMHMLIHTQERTFVDLLCTLNLNNRKICGSHSGGYEEFYLLQIQHCVVC